MDPWKEKNFQKVMQEWALFRSRARGRVGDDERGSRLVGVWKGKLVLNCHGRVLGMKSIENYRASTC